MKAIVKTMYILNGVNFYATIDALVRDLLTYGDKFSYMPLFTPDKIGERAELPLTAQNVEPLIEEFKSNNMNVQITITTNFSGIEMDCDFQIVESVLRF